MLSFVLYLGGKESCGGGDGGELFGELASFPDIKAYPKYPGTIMATTAAIAKGIRDELFAPSFVSGVDDGS